MPARISLKREKNEQYTKAKHNFLPIVILFAMICSLLLLDAVLPLQTNGFSDALLRHLGAWPLLPTHILFPGFAVVPTPLSKHIPYAVTLAHSLRQTALLFGGFLIVFLLYLFALRRLPQMITFRYILISTILLGIVCVLIPVVTSQDIFSYIGYARMAVIYHLNPLIAMPTQISTDPIYSHIYWKNQPSLYGPAWVAICSLLQKLMLILGLQDVVFMVLALRLTSLAIHLGSTFLIWSISGHLQIHNGSLSPTRRLLATLAFAWNPLLLIEACINAHVDTATLFFILLAIWFLVRNEVQSAQTPTSSLHAYRASLLAMALFAVATSLKLNATLLVLGLLLFLWTQFHKVRLLIAATATYLTVTILLYAPFWPGKALLHTLLVNPASFRDINTLPDFLTQLFNSIGAAFGQPIVKSSTISPVEHITHTLSTGIFAIIFVILCWQAIRTPSRINNTAGLIRWLTLVWLLYCVIGSPWFWPWYMVTFFGLYALVEATNKNEAWPFTFFRLPLAIYLLTFSMVMIYCFSTWALLHGHTPGLPGFLWADFRGLVWLLPLFALDLRTHSQVSSSLHTQKLTRTRWLEVWTLLNRGIQHLRPTSRL